MIREISIRRATIMMGTSDPQPSMFYHINLEQYVTADHPMRKIRPLIETARIRQLCEPLYAETGRPSIPPEQLFLALRGGYLLASRRNGPWFGS
jgi:transposase